MTVAATRSSESLTLRRTESIFRSIVDAAIRTHTVRVVLTGNGGIIGAAEGKIEEGPTARAKHHGTVSVASTGCRLIPRTERAIITGFVVVGVAATILTVRLYRAIPTELLEARVRAAIIADGDDDASCALAGCQRTLGIHRSSIAVAPHAE